MYLELKGNIYNLEQTKQIELDEEMIHIYYPYLCKITLVFKDAEAANDFYMDVLFRSIQDNNYLYSVNEKDGIIDVEYN